MKNNDKDNVVLAVVLINSDCGDNGCLVHSNKENVEEGKISSGANSRAFLDGLENIFGGKAGSKADNLNESSSC